MRAKIRAEIYEAGDDNVLVPQSELLTQLFICFLLMAFSASSLSSEFGIYATVRIILLNILRLQCYQKPGKKE